MSTRVRIRYGRLLVYCLVAIVLLISVIPSEQVYARPASSLLAIPYHAQVRMHYCGPASVQMTIEYVSGIRVQQDTLAVELKTDVVQGVTRRSMMSVPISSREFPLTHESYMALDDLKEQNSRGYVSILLIWFDTDHKSDHYVVMVGYNETGVIVNDPWPGSWRQPTGRRTGEHAFISNQLLADLWARSDRWALVIPYPSYSQSHPTTLALNSFLYIALVVTVTISALVAALIYHRTRTNHHPHQTRHFLNN